MSKFESTLTALRSCYDQMNDGDMTNIPDSEKDAAIALLELCRKITSQWSDVLSALDVLAALDDVGVLDTTEQAAIARTHCWNCGRVYDADLPLDRITGRQCPNCGSFEFNF